jgi:hypothetical protein
MLFIFFIFISNCFCEQWVALVVGNHKLVKPISNILPKVKITHHFTNVDSSFGSYVRREGWSDYSGTSEDLYSYKSYYKVYQFEGNKDDIVYSLYGGMSIDDFGEIQIISLERNYIVKKTGCRIAPNTGATNGFKPGYFSYGLDVLDTRSPTMDLKYCTATSGGGTGVDVFILDTGFASPVPLHVKSNHVVREFDAYPNGNFCSDLDGHGTHTGCLFVSDYYGGAPNITLHVYKVLNDDGTGTLADILNAFIQIYISNYTNGVISMSLGVYLGNMPGSPSAAIDNLVQQLIVTKNFIIGASAGNDANDACNNYPSRIDGIISVGAVDQSIHKASYTNYGSCVHVFAPGSDIISGSLSLTGSARYYGTSQALPIAMSIMCLYIEHYGVNTDNDFIITKFLNFTSVNRISGLDSLSPNKLPYIGAFDFDHDPPSSISNGNVLKCNILILYMIVCIFFSQ